nr:unnamed protein product [Callosobruchus analis]
MSQKHKRKEKDIIVAKVKIK